MQRRGEKAAKTFNPEVEALSEAFSGGDGWSDAGDFGERGVKSNLNSMGRPLRLKKIWMV